MWKVLILEPLLFLLLLALAVYAWVRFNNSKKFTKVVKDVRFKPEQPDAEASAGAPTGEENKEKEE
jgi:hypothetical protein